MRETALGPCHGAPALSIWRHRLAVAWVDGEGGGEIIVAVGPVPPGIDPGEEFVPETRTATGLTSPSGSVALATFENHLMLAWVDAASSLQVTTIKTGGVPGPPVEVAAEVLDGVSMTAHDRLILAWRTFGNRVMVTESEDGSSFEAPTEVAHTSSSDPSVATIEHPYHGKTLVMTVADSDSRVLTATGNQFASLDEPGAPTGIGTTRPISMTPTEPPVGSRPGLVFLYRDGDRVAFWNADLDLDLYGANPYGPVSEFDPAALAWGGDLIVAYVETEIARQLRIGSWTSVFGIPPDLADRIGEPCDPRQCTDDPRLVCVLSGHTEIKDQEARIVNARAGDIVLTPADGEGVIGTILKALKPAEFYDHMGLMVEDYDTIRHCTESKSRLIDDEDYYSGDLVGEPAPSDGLRPDLVKYGWPGPITQSIQNGFFDGWNDAHNPAWDHHELAWATAHGQLGSLSEPQRRAFFDQEFPEKPFRITNLTYGPTYRPDHDGPLHPLVVRPSVAAEEEFPWVRWALGRVVAEARRTVGHYRFFAYSDATIATDPSRFAPAPGDSSWDGLPAGADWAAGTPGIVCSTFLWLAATRALADLRPNLLLDQDALHPQDGTGREQAGAKIDGLYAYREPERIDAANGLHDWIVKTVETVVREKVDETWTPLARIGTAIIIGVVAGVIAGPAAGVVAAAVAAAGLSPTEMKDIANGLTDMPEQVANGVCNAFAVDRPERVDDTDWKSPGTGLSVSPDNIWSFWDAPADNGETRGGLWGTAVQAKLANPRPELVETGTLQLSPGVCHVTGQVTFRREAVRGAEVFVGCRKAVTDVKGGFRLDVPGNEAGQEQLIRVQADWEQPRGMLTAKLQRSLPPGEVDLGRIELDPPPEWRRRIEMHGELTMIFKVLIGHDKIDHHIFSKSLFAQVDPGIIARDPGRGIAGSTLTFSESGAVCGGHTAHFFGTLRVLDPTLDGLPGVPPRPAGAPDLSLVVDWTYEMLEDGERDDAQTGTLVIPPGESRELSPSLRDGEVPPDRAHSQITIENLTNPA